MPSRNATYECFCRLCTDGSPPGPDGKLKGRIFPLSQKSAHLARLAAVNEALRQAAVIDAAAEAFKALSLIDSDVPMSSPTGGSPTQSMQQSNQVPRVRLPKSERSKLTRTAHAILDVVEQRVHVCLGKISETPTVETTDFLEDELIRLQVLYDSVKRSVGSITTRKSLVGGELSKIRDHVAELRQLHTDQDKPLHYDSSKCLCQ